METCPEAQELFWARFWEGKCKFSSEKIHQNFENFQGSSKFMWRVGFYCGCHGARKWLSSPPNLTFKVSKSIYGVTIVKLEYFRRCRMYCSGLYFSGKSTFQVRKLINILKIWWILQIHVESRRSFWEFDVRRWLFRAPNLTFMVSKSIYMIAVVILE